LPPSKGGVMAQHWVENAFPPFISLLRVLFLIAAVVPGFISMIKDQPLELIVLFFMLGAGASAFFLYYLLRLGDYIMARFEEAKVGSALADVLDERMSAGVSTMTIVEANTLWKDVAPPSHRHGAHTRLRWLKKAAERGHFPATLQPDGTAVSHSTVNIKELSEMMRRKDWKACCVY